MLVLTNEEIMNIYDEYNSIHGLSLNEFVKAIVEANDSKRGEITVTKNSHGQILAVTRTDDEHRILSVIAESTVGGLPKTRKDNWPFGASVGGADEALL